MKFYCVSQKYYADGKFEIGIREEKGDVLPLNLAKGCEYQMIHRKIKVKYYYYENFFESKEKAIEFKNSFNNIDILV